MRGFYEPSDDDPFAWIFALIFVVGTVYLIGLLEYTIWQNYGKQVGVLSIVLLIYLIFKFGEKIGELIEESIKFLSAITWIAIIVWLIFLFLRWFFS